MSLTAVEQNLRIDDLDGQAQATGVRSGGEKKFLPALTHLLARLQVGRARASHEATWRLWLARQSRDLSR